MGQGAAGADPRGVRSQPSGAEGPGRAGASAVCKDLRVRTALPVCLSLKCRWTAPQKLGALPHLFSACGTHVAEPPEFPAPPGDMSLETGCLPGIRVQGKSWGPLPETQS